MISNFSFTIKNVKSTDCFICAFGYEKRSYYIYEQIKNIISGKNMLIFVFQECSKIFLKEIVTKKIQKYESYYNQYDEVIKQLESFISHKKNVEKQPLTLYIDYSSMPRSWYCRIKDILAKFFDSTDRAFFCYTEGSYPVNYTAYPTAGIDSFVVFKGKASLNPHKRVHLIAMGYDVVRSQAITDIIDPEKYIAIIACDSKRKDIEKKCRELNIQLLKRAIQIVTLHIDDFEFMISKLREIINDFLSIGDVVLVPDGPKPLILAMSMVIDNIDKNGVTCLHISRNENYHSNVNVTPSDRIISFCYTK